MWEQLKVLLGIFHTTGRENEKKVRPLIVGRASRFQMYKCNWIIHRYCQTETLFEIFKVLERSQLSREASFIPWKSILMVSFLINTTS